MMTNKKILKIIIVISIYVALCFFLQGISFGPLQLRISELLCLLTIENPIYIIAVSVGCFISNLLFSTLGSIDAIVGTLATLLGCSLGYLLRKIKIKGFPIVSALIISLVNAVVISLETSYVLNNNEILLISFIEILISEIIILVIIGFPIYNRLIKIDKGE